MTRLCEIRVPDVGNVAEIDVVEVLIQAGDIVELEQTVATLETDKASMDLPSSAAGTIQQVYIKPGDTVSEGSLIATVLVSDAEVSEAEPAAQPAAVVAETPAPAVVVEKAPEPVSLPVQRAPEPKAPEVLQAPEVSGAKAHASPSVRLFARELGVDVAKIKTG
ncbi:MAG: dihydrolipoyllysine-residue acetyltransferase, partial [Pseudomonadota bacterium]